MLRHPSVQMTTNLLHGFHSKAAQLFQIWDAFPQKRFCLQSKPTHTCLTHKAAAMPEVFNSWKTADTSHRTQHTDTLSTQEMPHFWSDRARDSGCLNSLTMITCSPISTGPLLLPKGALFFAAGGLLWGDEGVNSWFRSIRVALARQQHHSRSQRRPFSVSNLHSTLSSQ